MISSYRVSILGEYILKSEKRVANEAKTYHTSCMFWRPIEYGNRHLGLV